MRNDHPSKGMVIPKMVRNEDLYTKKQRRLNDAKTRITPVISKAGLNLIKNRIPFMKESVSVT
jgi:hypothetical protein